MKSTYKIAILLVTLGVGIAVVRSLLAGSIKPPVSTTKTSTSVMPPDTKSTAYHFIAAAWYTYGNNGAVANYRKLLPTETGLPADTVAYRIQVEKTGKQIYDIGFGYHFFDQSFTAGQPVTLHFKARSRSANLIAVQLQEDEAPRYLPCWTQFIRLTSDWKDYSYTFPSANYATGKSLLVFKLGQNTGTTDFADISLKKG